MDNTCNIQGRSPLKEYSPLQKYYTNSYYLIFTHARGQNKEKHKRMQFCSMTWFKNIQCIKAK
jgi:hypothetical protein